MERIVLRLGFLDKMLGNILALVALRRLLFFEGVCPIFERRFVRGLSYVEGGVGFFG